MLNVIKKCRILFSNSKTMDASGSRQRNQKFFLHNFPEILQGFFKIYSKLFLKFAQSFLKIYVKFLTFVTKVPQNFLNISWKLICNFLKISYQFFYKFFQVHWEILLCFTKCIASFKSTTHYSQTTTKNGWNDETATKHE